MILDCSASTLHSSSGDMPSAAVRWVCATPVRSLSLHSWLFPCVVPLHCNHNPAEPELVLLLLSLYLCCCLKMASQLKGATIYVFEKGTDVHYEVAVKSYSSRDRTHRVKHVEDGYAESLDLFSEGAWIRKDHFKC